MDFAKERAANELLKFIQPDFKIGLGTGSTIEVAMKFIYEKNLATNLNLQFVYSSKRTQNLAKEFDFKNLLEFDKLDLVLDGADIILKNGFMIKGLGGALLKEKILAEATDNYIIMADEVKLKNDFNSQIVPIEISDFNPELTLIKINNLGGKPMLRKTENALYKTDNGNLIADTFFEKIANPMRLATDLKQITGVIEHGFFLDFKPILILGSTNKPTQIIYT